MSNTSTHPKTTAWIMALIISVALNGLLAGLLMSGKVEQKRHFVNIGSPQTTPTIAKYDNPRKLLRHLEPKRRKEIMRTAMKRTRKNATASHRELMKELRLSRQQTLAILRSPDLDEDAFQKQLTNSRLLKDQLARQGDALVLEIFKQLTPAERISVSRTRHKNNRKAQQKPNK